MLHKHYVIVPLKAKKRNIFLSFFSRYRFSDQSIFRHPHINNHASTHVTHITQYMLFCRDICLFCWDIWLFCRDTTQSRLDSYYTRLYSSGLRTQTPVCCRVLQCVAVHYNVFKCVAVMEHWCSIIFLITFFWWRKRDSCKIWVWPDPGNMYEWVMSHIWMSHVTHMNESCHTCEWVMSHI